MENNTHNTCETIKHLLHEKENNWLKSENERRLSSTQKIWYKSINYFAKNDSLWLFYAFVILREKKTFNESIPLLCFGILNGFICMAEYDSGEKCILIVFDWIFLLQKYKFQTSIRCMITIFLHWTFDYLYPIGLLAWNMMASIRISVFITYHLIGAWLIIFIQRWWWWS